MKITVEEYGVLCDVVVRAVHNWPVEPDDENPFSHTSDYAREAANRILRELNLELDDPGTTLVHLANLIAYRNGLERASLEPELMKTIFDETGWKPRNVNGEELYFMEDQPVQPGIGE